MQSLTATSSHANTAHAGNSLTTLFDEDFSSPSALVSDGWIYLYGTSGPQSLQANIQLRRSRSWKGPWEDIGGALTDRPHWGKNSQEFHSPHAPYRHSRSEYRLYYVTDPDDLRGPAIAMARSSTPQGFNPSDRFVMQGNESPVMNPFVLSYKERQFLYWGSRYDPIMCRELDASGCEFARHSYAKAVIYPNEELFEEYLEGFSLKYHRGLNRWFGFVSGTSSTDKDISAITCYYSRSPFGPFTRIGMLASPCDTWRSLGKTSIVTIGDTWYVLYHSIRHDSVSKRDICATKRIPCVARVSFESGTPQLVRV